MCFVVRPIYLFHMKTIYYLLPVLLIFFISSCNDDSSPEEDLDKEVEDLIRIKTISNDDHSIEIFSTKANFFHGYNDLTLRIIDKATDEYVTNATMSWKPVMNMMDKMHSCPKSDIEKVFGKKTLYHGYIVFQMPGNPNEGWDLTINYTLDGVSYSAKDAIQVIQSEKRVVSVFTGADEVRYILALMEPAVPEVKVNDITAGLFKMQDMMNFPVVENFKIALDPRMPSMGNHSSPANEDLTYNATDEIYEGKLSLTMTGYWMLNLQLMNQADEVLKGEEVTEENESSSLYFEIEF